MPEYSNFRTLGFLSEEAEVKEDQIKENHQRYRDVFLEVSRLAHEILMTMEVPVAFDKLYIATAFGRLLAVCQAIVFLSDRGFQHDATAEVRVAFEALLRVIAACTDEELLENMTHGDILKRKTLAETLLKGEIGNPSTAGRPHVEQSLRELENFLKGSQGKKLPTEAIARRLGLESFYDTVFRWTSQDIHVSMFALEEFIVTNADGQPVSLKYEQSDEAYPRNVTAATEFLLLALEKLQEPFELALGPQIHDLYAKITSVINADGLTDS